MARIAKEESTLKGIVRGLETESSVLERIWKFECATGGLLFTVGVVLVQLGYGWTMVGVGALLVFLGAAHSMKRKDNKSDIGRFKGGAEGESRVSKILQAGLPDSYIILNDISVTSGSRSAQNDHIVLGPNGVFVIETKAYSGSLTGTATDEYVRQVKTYNGKTTENRIKNPLPQNEYHMKIVGEKMAEAGFAIDDVRSIIVFTSRWVQLAISGAKVPVIKPEMLPATILEAPSLHSYDEKWLARLVALLCPEAKLPAPASGGGSKAF